MARSDVPLKRFTTEGGHSPHALRPALLAAVRPVPIALRVIHPPMTIQDLRTAQSCTSSVVYHLNVLMQNFDIIPRATLCVALALCGSAAVAGAQRAAPLPSGTAQVAAVEPDLDAAGTKRFTDACARFCVLGGVGKEDCARGVGRLSRGWIQLHKSGCGSSGSLWQVHPSQ